MTHHLDPNIVWTSCESVYSAFCDICNKYRQIVNFGMRAHLKLHGIRDPTFIMAQKCMKCGNFMDSETTQSNMRMWLEVQNNAQLKKRAPIKLAE